MAQVRNRLRLLASVASVSVLGALFAFVPAGARASTVSLGVGNNHQIQVQRVGSVNLATLSKQAVRAKTSPRDGVSTEFGNWANEEQKAPVANGIGAPPPSPPGTAVVSGGDRTGFNGINHADQRLANGGNQFSLEPPDQGLCAGGVSPNGSVFGPEVVESVNDALVVYDATGERFTNPISLSEFYDLPPTFDRQRGVFGPFESDPKCYFDPDTQRWFHTMLVISQDPTTGAFEAPTYTYIAVSTSSEALGSYIIYRIDTTNLDHPNCPCFGDQPLIGADKYGFYISTAEYSLEPFGGFFNGPQLYALSKAGLESGALSSVLITGITHTVHDRTTGTLQPATTPDAAYNTANRGTEYFLSGFDCVASAACAIAQGQFNRITVWALTNTASLDTATPAPHLTRQDIQVDVYGSPVPMTQRPGPIPLGNFYGHTDVGVLNPNDSRMNQVVFADGRLWSGINTLVEPDNRTGIEYFVVDPSVSNHHVSGSIHTQGYVAVDGNNVAFPSIGVTGQGQGLIVFTLVGPDYFPSPADILIDGGGTTGDIASVAKGFRPEDGFTCYPEPSGGSTVCRWGDYSASVATPDGLVISATEFIPYADRTFFANWGTFIWKTQR